MLRVRTGSPDGATTSKRVRQFLGSVNQISERAARREHDRIIQDVNRRRGSVASAYRGQTFADAVRLWREQVAPHLSPATGRARGSAFKLHVLTRIRSSAPHAMSGLVLQQISSA